MLQRFCQFIADNRLFSKEDKILITVSGGMDSVTLSDLFHKAGYNFGIAHCNFGLRAEESDEDEAFVKKLAKKYKVPCYTEQFETQVFADKEKISIQMAARQLRYRWFEELRKKEGYAYIATAHQAGDVLETVLLNIVRGTGIAGMNGIRAKTGHLVRPLLFADREDIKEYMAEHQLGWREDSSNESTKYQRNYLRHEVVPLLKTLNPNIEHTLQTSVQRTGAAERVFRNYIDNLKTRVWEEDKEAIYIKENLLPEADRAALLYELLIDCNFSFADVKSIVATEVTGKIIESPTHVLAKDRERLTLTPKSLGEYVSSYIAEGQTELHEKNLRLKITSVDITKFKLDTEANTACLDYDKLIFPLQLRRWKDGDWFCPLGMNKKKKVSDFLIDSKVAVNLKDKVYVLCSAGSIVWVVGRRVDERYKISDKTKTVLVIRKE